MKQKLILIGSSTGGPGQLKILLRDLALPPHVSIVVAQHMRKFFMQSFVDQFNEEFAAKVELLTEKTNLENKIYICEKNTVICKSQVLSAKPDDSGTITTFNPNVDMLFESGVEVARYFDIMAILMTGIGEDGAKGLADLYKRNVKCIAENEEDCIVFGMPKRAKEMNQNLRLATVKEIKFELERFINETEN